VENGLATELLAGNFKDKGRVIVDAEDGHIVFRTADVAAPVVP